MTADGTAADRPQPPAGAGGPIRAPAHRVSPRARRYWAVRAALGWTPLVVLEAVALLADWRFPPQPGLLLAVTLPLAVLHVAVMPPWRYRVHRWEITATDVPRQSVPAPDVPPAVFTRSGWWTQRWRIAPLSRVQTVDTTRGPLARLFGLSTVTVTTASAAGPVEIAAVDSDVAERIARTATDAAQATRDDAT